VRKEVIDAVMRNPAVEVRDLFERFVPDAERVQRLGDVVNTEDILNLKGDTERGRQLFFAGSASQCKNCHRIQGVGETLGPDLSQIGAKYTRPALLQHILEPSRSVEPKYVSYLLETKAGQVHSGLLVEKTEREVVLRDARNQAIRVPAAEVEQLVPQTKSFMPELLVRDLTAQQVADLLEFLSAQR
jgi:putative heme-binding domain-containing protein